MIVRAIADECDVGHVSKSTEETIFKLEDYNVKRDNLNAKNVTKLLKVIIGSMDIDKWYPSQIPGPSAKGIRDMFEESKVKFEGINYDKVSKYLGEYLTEDEIKKEEMEEIVYIKIKKVKKVKVKNTKTLGKKQARKLVINVNRKQNRKGKTLNTKDGGGKANIDKTVTNVNKEQKEKGKTLNTKAGGGKENTDKEVQSLKTVENVNGEQKGKEKTVNTNAGGGKANADKEIQTLKTVMNVNKEQKENTLNTKDVGDQKNLGNVTSANDEGKQKRAHKEKFTAPIRKPTKSEERIMLGKAIEIMIKAGMENHVYRFHNKIRIQKTGGPIGLALTGEVADCYMLNWDKKFLNKLKTLGMVPLVYSRFKDDILIAIEALEKGTKYVEGNLIIDDKQKLEDEDESDTKVTMQVLKDVAESIDSMLRFTIDTPHPMQLQ